MKRLILLASLIPCAALAQSAPPSPNEQALGAEVMECVGGKVSLRTQLAALQTRVLELTKELDAARTAPPASQTHEKP
jgi:hypothetical protein